MTLTMNGFRYRYDLYCEGEMIGRPNFWERCSQDIRATKHGSGGVFSNIPHINEA